MIAGHRVQTYGRMFNRLGELQRGDLMHFTDPNGNEAVFEIFEIAVIAPEDQIAFVQPTASSIITLYTCTPIDTATHRLIVRGERINDERRTND